MNTKIFSVILLASMMALVGGIAAQGIVSEEAFAKGPPSVYGCGHDTQGYESSEGKCHHHNDD
jgi:hypothetical protein